MSSKNVTCVICPVGCTITVNYEGDKVLEGLILTSKTTASVFEKLGVEVYGNPGDTFDPNIHNAVFHIDDPSYGEGEIVEVFQKGYKKGNKIIRFAMVKTAN
jgi:molecular chaperone GrpE